MSPRQALARAGETIRSQPLLFAALALWAFAPLVAQLLHVIANGGVLTGTNGADLFDQFQYLAWIRDEGRHLLASNLWSASPTPHDYLHPMYLISGLLWRVGASIQLAYLVWKPVALLVLFAGFAAYVRRLLPDRRGAQAAALGLALFYQTPALALASWTGHLSAAHQLQLVLASDDANAALNLWGFDHAAIAIGLMPVFLLATERLLAQRRPATGWGVVAALAGALVSWLHPWQGVMLLGIVGALFVLAPPRRRFTLLIVPSLCTLAPLIYGLALTHWDSSWHAFRVSSTITGTAPWWALLVSLGPLVAVALAGAIGPREHGVREDGELMLLLWLVACAVVYFAVPEFPPHALAGVTLPLSVLAVRGWSRARGRLQGSAAAWFLAAVTAVGVFTVPAAVHHAEGVRDQLAPGPAGGVALQELRLTADQSAALRYLDRATGSGTVLAPWLLSLSVPEFTGRRVYVGHLQWQPPSHLALATAFFATATPAPQRKLLLRATAARFVIADCDAPAGFGRQLAPLGRPLRRFGCVTVYETAPAGS